MNTFEQLMELGKQINHTAKDKGFWDDGNKRNKAEMVMLMVSELGECLEGHRKLKACYGHTDLTREAFQRQYKGTESEYNQAWKESFEFGVKDTYQDEMADVMIRLLDYVYGWDIPVLLREYRKETTGNFGADLLRINWYIMLAFETQHAEVHPGKDWGYAIAAIIKFCEWYKIDLIQHCEWKMKYNASREHKHGKAY